jgi:hypothetical protein
MHDASEAVSLARAAKCHLYFPFGLLGLKVMDDAASRLHLSSLIVLGSPVRPTRCAEA